ncbi:beclin-2 [Ctenodactylus gundi]
MSSLRFLCQRCSQPLKLSPSSVHADPRAQEGRGTPTKQTESGGRRPGNSRRPLPGSGPVSQESTSRFTLVGDLVSLRSLGSIQKVTADIFDFISGHREVDQPLCEECTDGLLHEADAQIVLAQLDTERYQSCLETRVLVQDQGEGDALRRELQGLELEEARLVQELEGLDEDWARAAAGLRAARAHGEELRQRDAQHQRDYSALKLAQLELLDQVQSVENQLQYAQAQLHRLRSTDIFRATFEIREEGPVGVINDLRLGCLPRARVGWPEINAAWGQVALLLLALAHSIGLRFQRYQLVPCGGHSYLKTLTGDGALLPLFSDGRHNVFLDNKFDQAMVAFLDCLQQFQDEAARGEGLRPPYRVRAAAGLLEDGHGESCPIRLHLNTEEQWTKALRLVLRNLKCGLAWASAKHRRK